MAQTSSIEWTDATWNPIRGCTRVSEGCRNCYAERMAARFIKPGMPYEGLAYRADNGEARWTGALKFIPEALREPLHWKKPRRIFVNSMSDLFHGSVKDEWLDQIFAVMALCPQHTFQILTKRPERMVKYLNGPYEGDGVASRIATATWAFAPSRKRLPEPPVICELPVGPRLENGLPEFGFRRFLHPKSWPLPNVWLGVSVEDQSTAEARIPLLRTADAAVRFLSCEPLLGRLDLTPWLTDKNGAAIDWVIFGGESGPGARPAHPGWFRKLRNDCTDAGTPFFFKQWGEFYPDDPAAHTTSLRLVGKRKAGRVLDGRTHDEFPKVATA